MGNGVLKKIVSEEKFFDLYIGEPWYKITFNQKGSFLKNLSRARQITGHSPFFRVLDDSTQEIVAKVTEKAIEILLPGEGFFQYLFVIEEKRNTFY